MFNPSANYRIINSNFETENSVSINALNSLRGTGKTGKVFETMKLIARLQDEDGKSVAAITVGIPNVPDIIKWNGFYFLRHEVVSWGNKTTDETIITYRRRDFADFSHVEATQ